MRIVWQNVGLRRINNMNFDEYPELLKPGEVSQILRVSLITLQRWSRTNKDKLPFIAINGRGDRRYRKQDVLKFLGE